jgi:hypothetical protein
VSFRKVSHEAECRDIWMLTYSSSKLYFTLALYQDVNPRCFGSFQDVSNLVTHFVHALEKADVSSLNKVKFDWRAYHFTLFNDSVGGLLVATDDDDSKSRSAMTMSFAQFPNSEFADSIGRSNKDSSK